MNSPYYSAPRRFSSFPPCIKFILAANVLIFVVQQTSADYALLAWFALWPAGTPELVYDGYGLVSLPQFWPWQLFTYGFLHGGFTHLAINMFAIWMFGVQIEHTVGSRRFAMFYVVCVLGAGLVQLIVASAAAQNGPAYPTVGASGGLFGILLAFGMMYPNRRIMLLFPPIPMKAKYFVMGYGALELFMGITGTSSGVAHFAHLGGMLFGFLIIQYWRNSFPFNRKAQ